MAATLVLDIVANASRAVAGLREVDRAAGRASSGAETMRSRIGGMAKAAGVAAGAAALGGLVVMLKTGVGEQSDFLAGQAQLANGIESTGNAANVSVTGLENLAASVQGYSGQTDDSIVASEKLLLTFTNVRNAAGKNNDIFTQATKITADMAAKMGGDASKYAVQLGKALNDPAKGLTSLTRIGVSFTDAQKKQIKAMQAAGDTVGAQKVIMAELTREFGGSAKAAGNTLPGQLARAKRSFEDVSQSLVASLMPVLLALAGFLLNTLIPALKGLIDFMMRNKTAVLIVATALGVLAAAIKIATIAQRLFNITLMTNPIFLIVTAIVALVAILVVAYMRCATFRAIVQAVFRAVVAAARAVASGFTAAFRAVVAAVQFCARWVQTIIRSVVSFLLHSPIAAALLGPWRIAIGILRAFLSGGIAGVLHYLGGLVSAVGRVMHGVINAIVSPFRAAFDAVRGIVEGVVDWIAGKIRWVGSVVGGAIGGIKKTYNAFARTWNSIQVTVAGKKLPGPIPDIPGFTFGLPDLPMLASGGYVTRATLAVVGEGRSGEIVAPEPMLRQIIRDELGGGGINLTINGALDPDAVARQLESVLTRRARRVSGVQIRGVPVPT